MCSSSKEPRAPRDCTVRARPARALGWLAEAGSCQCWAVPTVGARASRGAHLHALTLSRRAPTACCYHSRWPGQDPPPPTLEVTTSLEAWEGLRRGRDGDRGAGCTLVLPPRHPVRLRLCLRRSPELGQSSQRDGGSDASWVPGCRRAPFLGGFCSRHSGRVGREVSSFVGSGRDCREDCLRPETFQGADASAGPLRPGRAAPGQM